MTKMTTNLMVTMIADMGRYGVRFLATLPKEGLLDFNDAPTKNVNVPWSTIQKLWFKIEDLDLPCVVESGVVFPKSILKSAYEVYQYMHDPDGGGGLTPE